MLSPIGTLQLLLYYIDNRLLQTISMFAVYTCRFFVAYGREGLESYRSQAGTVALVFAII